MNKYSCASAYGHLEFSIFKRQSINSQHSQNSYSLCVYSTATCIIRTLESTHWVFALQSFDGRKMKLYPGI